MPWPPRKQTRDRIGWPEVPQPDHQHRVRAPIVPRWLRERRLSWHERDCLAVVRGVSRIARYAASGLRAAAPGHA
jgi:hypothetical protein